MDDGVIHLRIGENRRVYVQLNPSTGTLTIQTGGTVGITKLYDDSAIVAAGTAVTGRDTAATSSPGPRAWYKWSTTGLAAGMYRAEFVLDADDASANRATYRPTVLIRLI